MEESKLYLDRYTIAKTEINIFESLFLEFWNEQKPKVGVEVNCSSIKSATTGLKLWVENSMQEIRS